MIKNAVLVAFAMVAGYLQAAEFHVATNGNDGHAGSGAMPFLTIQHAADIAQPGDTVTVHAGVYRERINPPRGGTSDVHRITYRAAPGEEVVIKGSEPVSGWTHVTNDTWMVTLSNSFFGAFNPFDDLIQGPWFDDLGRDHHTGAVYLDGEWLAEATALSNVLFAANDPPLWFAQVDVQDTMIHAQFPGVDPNSERVEINARQTVFYPDQPGRNYITVRGFTLTQAATPWSPPTIEQIGLIGTHWSKGWIVESNAISHSVCAGLTLGLNDRGVYAGTLAGYTQLIHEAMGAGGWNKDEVGSHIVRGNRIFSCEQAGICGSLGGAFSLLENNEISYIYARQLFAGQEQGSIKLHGAVDTIIRNNLVHNGPRAIWLDWMGQGAEISGNVAFSNSVDLYLEVNHGPALVANNLFLSPLALSQLSRGTAFAHNLFAGRCSAGFTDRSTPYLDPHSTIVAGYHTNYPGDDRFYNNVYAGRTPTYASWVGEYGDPELPVTMQDNLFIKGSQPYTAEVNAVLFPSIVPDLEPVQKSDGIYIEWASLEEWTNTSRKVVTSDLLGTAGVSGVRFEQADGSSIRVDRDYFGSSRDEQNLIPGPFELPTGNLQVRIWPKDEVVFETIAVTTPVPFVLNPVLTGSSIDGMSIDDPSVTITTNASGNDLVYSFTYANVDLDGGLQTNDTLSWDLRWEFFETSALSTGQIAVGTDAQGGLDGSVGWGDSTDTVDWNDDTLTFSVENISLTADAGYTAVFDGFDGMWLTAGTYYLGEGTGTTSFTTTTSGDASFGPVDALLVTAMTSERNRRLTGSFTVLPPPKVESGYDAWAGTYNLTGDDALESADVESDGLNNLMEYALGGNPTNDDAAIVLPSSQITENYFYYVHNERTDDTNLTYAVELTTNLVSYSWTTHGVEFVGQAPFSNVWKTITNRTEIIEDAKFIRLKLAIFLQPE